MDEKLVPVNLKEEEKVDNNLQGNKGTKRKLDTNEIKAKKEN